MTVGETTDLTCDVCGLSSFIATITWYPGGAQRCGKHQLRKEDMIDAHDPAWNGDGTAKLMAGVADQVRANGERIVDDIRDAAMAPRVTWLTRLRWKLFPTPARPLDWSDKRTFLTTEIYTQVDWRDRLRCLVGGRLRVTVINYTDVEVKAADARSVVWFE